MNQGSSDNFKLDSRYCFWGLSSFPLYQSKKRFLYQDSLSFSAEVSCLKPKTLRFFNNSLAPTIFYFNFFSSILFFSLKN